MFEFQDIQTPVQRTAAGDVLMSSSRSVGEGQYIHTVTFGAGSIGKETPIKAHPAEAHINSLIFADGGVVSAFSTNSDRIDFKINDQLFDVTSVPADWDFFENQNVGFAVHNLESLDTIVPWLRYHTETQGMTAALIICRQRKSLGDTFVANLHAAARAIPGLKKVMVWSTDAALGKPDLPSELDPITVKGAPGKDRMIPGAADPQTSPLNTFQIYEMMHQAYLRKARAVMNLDLHDLIIPEDDISVFDKAANSETGLITLQGQPCYSWKPKSNEIKFADHIYVPFDAGYDQQRWCVCPNVDGPQGVWRIIRVVGLKASGDSVYFQRFMGLKHSIDQTSKLVAKSSLVQSDVLMNMAQHYWHHDPVRMPREERPSLAGKSGTAIVTTMKNEGPFILEWLAYHRVIGVDHFLVYTNDCTDGTDTFLELLQSKGYVQHRNNDFKSSGLKPQHHALREAESEPLVTGAEWIICMDVDEYITVKVGDGTLDALYDHMGDANMVAINWRLFGNNDIHEFSDRPITEQFTQCAPEYTRKPHQAWGFKTLFRNEGIFRKLGVHRPKGLKPQFWDDIHWLNGSGRELPANMFGNAWRTNNNTYGYDMVQLNHYAVRSAESFLVKRDRGRVNHVDRDQGTAYWFRMNNNAEPNHDIAPILPLMLEEMERLLADPEIAEMHQFCVQRHKEKITQLKQTQKFSDFYDLLTGDRMQRMSRMHKHFGANVFLAGPDVVPDEVIYEDHRAEFFFTVDVAETQH